MTALQNRYDFVLLFDVKDGNPNGDPDAGNLPRTDPETGEGLVTDVCLKRKIRNYVSLTQSGKEGFDIYIKEKAVLSAQQGLAYKALGIEAPVADEEAEDSAPADEVEASKKAKKTAKKAKKSGDADTVDKARDWMCKRFFDIRAFGAVMSLKENNCGQVRGPVQLTFARSVDPVVPMEHSITRMAVATQGEAEKQGGDNRTMGRKNTVAYGLYRGYGFVSPALASKTGFAQADLEVLWRALCDMFEHDRSAARGLMSLRKLIVFKHESALGNAPAHRLFDLLHVERVDVSRPARGYTDYRVQIDAPPPGIEVLELPA